MTNETFEPNTGHYATIVADSVNPDGVRLTSIESCFQRFILAEMNTHRILSRNSASSRAIPVAKQLERIKNFPFIPKAFPVNQPGMSATEYLYPGTREYAEAADAWLVARDSAVEAVEKLLALNVHKQTANRLLEPFMWHTAIITATDYRNFFNLRISEHAQPEIRKTAELMKAAMDASTPVEVDWNGWHLPYVDADEAAELTEAGHPDTNLAEISAGRCAAVTLLNHQKKNVEKDLNRTFGLIANGHMSPLEHPAQAKEWDNEKPSNFHKTWKQLRKFIVGEAVYNG